MRMNKSVVDDLVVNMIDVGEETGELDTLLYKVADTFDEEVTVITESLMSMLEPLLILFLGGAVGFIVISLFMPLVSLISNLAAGIAKHPLTHKEVMETGARVADDFARLIRAVLPRVDAALG